MRTFLHRLACLLAMAALPGCGGDPSASASDAGAPDERPSIVSLNPCADAILAEIAAPGQLLAISHYSHAPRSASMPLGEARRFPATGGTAEEVLALAPDIVVADSFLAPSTHRALQSAGIRVERLGIASTLGESQEHIRQLGAAIDRKAAARALSSRVDAAWNESPPAGDPPTALLIQEGDIVPGPQSLAHALLERAGFTSLSAARGLGQGAHVPLERVLADPPDIVIAAGGGRMLGHPVLRSLPDMPRTTLDPTLLYCAGPTIPRALERLRAIRRSVQANR